MAIVSDVEIRLRADIARLQQDLNAARRSVSGAVGDIKKTLASMAAGFSLAALAGQVIDAQRKFDKLNSSLVTVTGSQKAAAEAMGALQDFAAKTPFGLQEVTTAFLKLRNLGLTPSERALTSYGNTASAMGKDLNQLIEAAADAATGEFERLKEFGIKAKQQGDQVAFTFQGTTTKVGKNADEIEAYLMAIGEVNFAGGMARQADTLDGDLSALGDTAGQTYVAFSQSGFGDELRSGIKSVSGALQDLQAIFKSVTGAAAEEGKKVEEIGPLHKGLTTFFEAVMVLGVNVAYVFKTIGKDIGAFGAQAAALFNGGIKGLTDGSTLKAIQDIGRARVAEAAQERAEVDKTSEAILGAAKQAQATREKEAADRAKDNADRLAQYKIQAKGAKTASDAEIKEAAKRLQAYTDLQSGIRKKIAESAAEAGATRQLNDAEKMAIDITEQLRTGKLKLTEAQQKNIDGLVEEYRANLASIEAHKALEKMRESAGDLDKEMAEQRKDALKAARDEAESNRELVRTFGMTESAIANLEVARLREQLAQRSSLGLTLDEITQLENLITLKEQSAAAIANREELEKTQAFWTDIEKTAHDTFMSIEDGGKGMWQRLKESARNTFFNWLYQMTVKKWIINIGATISGTGAVSGIAGAADLIGGAAGGGGIGSTLGLVGAASNLYGAFTGGATLAGGLGTGFLGSLAGGLNGAGIGSGLTSALGMNIGNGIASVVGPQVASGIATGLSGLAAAAPWVAGALAVYSIGKAAFGRGPKEFSGNSTLNGALGANGFSGTQDADWVKKGGWFRSDKRGVDRMAVDAAMSSGLADAYDAVKAASTGFADALGIDASNIANRTQTVRIALGKDEAANQKAIADFFSGVADTIAGEILPNIGQFQQAGETAAATLARVAANFQTVDQVLKVLGTDSQAAFGAVGTASLEARERLVALAGGVDSLAQQVQFFADNFLTKAQQIAPTQRELAAGLAALGYSSLETKEDFARAVNGLVDSGALATEEGTRLYTELLKLGPAFKAVADYAEEVQAAARDAGRIEADAALAELTRKVDAQKEVILAAVDATLGRLNANIETVNATIERTGDLSRALKGAIGTVDSSAQQAAMRQVAQAQITAALAIAKAGGSLPTADDLKDALAAVNRDASNQFATLADYQREVARTNNELLQMGGLADAQTSTAERQLLVLQEQAALVKAAADAQQARLDALVSNAQAQVSALSANNATLADIRGVAYSLYLRAAQVGNEPQNTLGAEMMRQLEVPAPNYSTPSATIGTDPALLAALQSLETRMANVETNTQRAALASQKFADQFEQVSAGGNALAVETMN